MLVSCNLTDNVASDGGAISSLGNLNIINSIFTKNGASEILYYNDALGGAIYCAGI